MEKILQYEYIKKTRTIKEITRKDMVDKINELVEGYNEIMKMIRDVVAWKHNREIEDIIINDK